MPQLSNPQTALARRPDVTLGALAEEVARANAYAAEARAENTLRAYRADAKAFETWCAARGANPYPAPPALVAIYLGWLADHGKKVASIRRALAGIAFAHRARRAAWEGGAPAVRDVLAGVAVQLGVAQAAKTPVEEDELHALLGACREGLAGVRDRALVTVGWFGALRRSEVVALDVADAKIVRDGIVLTVRRSKTDREGRGFEKALPFQSDGRVCPVRALQDWVNVTKLAEGPLFRGVNRHGHLGEARLANQVVARIIKRLARRAGLEPTMFAGHSLRAGFATTAARKGKGLDAIMRQTGHRSERIAMRYIRHGSLFINNAASKLF